MSIAGKRRTPSRWGLALRTWLAASSRPQATLAAAFVEVLTKAVIENGKSGGQHRLLCVPNGRCLRQCWGAVARAISAVSGFRLWVHRQKCPYGALSRGFLDSREFRFAG